MKYTLMFFLLWKYCDIAYISIENTHTVQKVYPTIVSLDMKGCTCQFWEVAGLPFHIQGAVMFITTSLCLLNFIMFIVYRHHSEYDLFYYYIIIILNYYYTLLLRYDIL